MAIIKKSNEIFPWLESNDYGTSFYSKEKGRRKGRRKKIYIVHCQFKINRSYKLNASVRCIDFCVDAYFFYINKIALILLEINVRNLFYNSRGKSNKITKNLNLL